jgi:hypothetical protein
MAVKIDSITIGDIEFIVLDSDPSSGAGYSAAVGSLASVPSSGAFFHKFNTSDTNWQQFSSLTPSGVSAGTYGSATKTVTITVDAYGMLTAASDQSIAIPSTQITDFTEASQDAVGGALQTGADVNLVYSDVANQISATLNTTAVSAGAYGSATAVATFTVDAKGRLTAASNATIAIPSTQVTDFNEAAQDAVGGILTDTTSVDFTYDDAGNTISAVVLPAGVDHNSLANLTTGDPHTQYAKLGGRSGGQTLDGDTASGGNLTLSSTANATKGKVIVGSVAIDEANTRLGVGTTSPTTILDLEENSVKYNLSESSTTTSGAVNAVVATVTTSANSVELFKVMITGLRTNGTFESLAYERTVRIKNVGGTVTTATVQSDYTSEDSALSAANTSFIISGSSVDVRVTGVTACDITWKCVAIRMR